MEESKRQNATLAFIPPFATDPWRVTELFSSASNQYNVLKGKLATRQLEQIEEAKQTAQTIKELRGTVEELHARQLKLEDDVLEERNALATILAQETATGSVKKDLDNAFEQLHELEQARACFQIIHLAEKGATTAVTAAQNDNSDQCATAFRSLTSYTETVREQARVTSAGSLKASTICDQLQSATFTKICEVYEKRLAESLEAIGWPTALDVNALDVDATKAKTFRRCFVHLNQVQQLNAASNADSSLLAITAMAHPVNLRFRYHFHGKRQTNRIDKPEWYFSQVLDAVAQHADILSADIQDLLDQSGYRQHSALHEYISELVEQVSRKLKSTVPQLLGVPPLLAHTIYQALDFDSTLKELYGYGPSLSPSHKSMADIILKNTLWFDGWKSAEKRYTEDRYYEIIADADAWQTSEDQGEITGSPPTKGAVAVKDLLEQVTDRYRPLPDFSQRLDFLVNVQLPILDMYQQRLTSAVDAIETSSIGIMRSVPGAIGEGSSARLTGGVHGLTRLLKASASVSWFSSVIRAWGDEVFFLDLQSDLAALDDRLLDYDAHEAVNKLDLGRFGDATLFAGYNRTFEALAARADRVAVKHMQREILAELKPYIAKPWDFDAPLDEKQTVSPDLTPALTLFSAFLAAVRSLLSPNSSQSLYRSLSVGLSDQLYARLATTRVFSQQGGQQLAFDVRDGWTVTAARLGFRRPGQGFQKLAEAACLLALSSDSPISIARTVSAAWSDSGDPLQQACALLDIHQLKKSEIQAVLKKRPECWH